MLECFVVTAGMEGNYFNKVGDIQLCGIQTPLIQFFIYNTVVHNNAR